MNIERISIMPTGAGFRGAGGGDKARLRAISRTGIWCPFARGENLIPEAIN